MSIAPTVDLPMFEGTVLVEPYDVPTGLQKLEDGQQVQPGQCLFSIMNPNGDDRLTWIRDNLTSIQAAKRAFVDFVKKGLKPYKVNTDGIVTAEVMDEFDPEAEEVIFMPGRPILAGG